MADAGAAAMIRLDHLYPGNRPPATRDTLEFLYALLSEREPQANISHRKMPTFREHINFVNSDPYHIWWLVTLERGRGSLWVGAAYVTRQHEIGIQISKPHQGQGYATRALHEIVADFHDVRLLANINPANAASIALFAKFGFKLIQHTYSREP
jgi:RimJ/RimL family protein N-acetyltransferase